MDNVFELKKIRIAWVTKFFIALSILVAPLYVWRFVFNIGGIQIPTNFLMLCLFVVIGIGVGVVVLTKDFQGLWESTKSVNKYLLASILLFCLASLISLFAFAVSAEKISQWVVLYFLY